MWEYRSRPASLSTIPGREIPTPNTVSPAQSTGGRKAKAYAPVRDARLAVGLDLTGNHVSVVLVDLSGQVVRYQRKSRPFSLDDAYLQGLGKLVQSVTEDVCAGETVLGVGTFCKMVGQLSASCWDSSIWEMRSQDRIQRRVLVRLRRLTSMLQEELCRNSGLL